MLPLPFKVYFKKLEFSQIELYKKANVIDRHNPFLLHLMTFKFVLNKKNMYMHKKKGILNREREREREKNHKEFDY
jgi:hypothetical protein